ncbi:hypothetical protein EON65_01405 [archaeon]|nr:MAG: hypothetical protein EON65_01405 [archaeon]
MLFSQSASDFQHFYELLLARRLLKGRYLTLSMERKILNLLPAMSKGELMIHDVAQSMKLTDLFRSYFLKKVDYDGLLVSNETIDLVLLPNRLTVNVLTASLWPSSLLAPLSFSSLCLPGAMNTIKQQFISFYNNQDSSVNNAWSLVQPKFKCLEISGSAENSHRINGTYEPTSERRDGWPIYVMQGAGYGILEYFAKTSTWQLKKVSDKGKNAGWAYCKVPSNSSPAGKDVTWYVWKKNIKRWIIQPITVVERAVSSTDSLLTEGAQRKSTKRIVWCHSAGTVLMKMCWPDETECFLRLSEPQAALLLLYNVSEGCAIQPSDDHLLDDHVVSYGDMISKLNLTHSELVLLLRSLTTARCPLLQFFAVGEESDTIPDNFAPHHLFKLSTQLKSAALGGRDENDPIVVPCSDTDNNNNSDGNYMNAGVLMLYGWRNEQIDACIVRLLKKAYVEKSGEFPSRSRNANTALSLDTLCDQVKISLLARCDVSFDDIMRRCERLVSVGIIDKQAGNRESLRSTAYGYIVDSESQSSAKDPGALALILDKKVSGADLFDHLKVILSIRSLPASAPGINFDLFRRKFLSWILESQCNWLEQENILDLLAKLVVQFLHTSVVQLNTLKLQFISGLNELQTRPLHRLLSAIEGLDVLEAKLLSMVTMPYSPVIHNYCDLTRSYVNFLPLALLKEIVRRFTSLRSHDMSIGFIDLAEEDDQAVFDSLSDIDELVIEEPSLLNSQLDTFDLSPRRKFLQDKVSLLWSTKANISKRTLKQLGIRLDILPLTSTPQTLDSDSYQEASVHSNNDGALNSFNHTNNPRSLLTRLSATGRHFAHDADRREWANQLLVSARLLGRNAAEQATQVYMRNLSRRHEQREDDEGDEGDQEDDNDNDDEDDDDEEEDDENDPDEDDSDDEDFVVTLTFEQFVSAIITEATEAARRDINENQIKCNPVFTFADCLDEMYFTRTVDCIARMFKVPLKFQDKQQEDNEGSIMGNMLSAPSQQEEMIPCEFCTDNIPVSLFEAHVLECRGDNRHHNVLQMGQMLHPSINHANAAALLSLLPGLPRNRLTEWLQSFQDPTAQTPQHRLLQPRGGGMNIIVPSLPDEIGNGDVPSQEYAAVKERPKARSRLGILLLESLLDDILAVCRRQVRDTTAVFTLEKQGFSSLLRSTFELLDRDGDGYLTSSDFADEELDFSDLSSIVNPHILYGNHHSTPNINMHSSPDFQSDTLRRGSFSRMSSPARLNLHAALDFNGDNMSVNELTPLALQKADSLWVSVSNEKSLPRPEASRSFCCVNETEQELVSLIEHVQFMLDDSQSTAIALLIHFKWDLKSLAEEYIENSRVVRNAVGLGPRNKPPFYRLDVYRQANSQQPNASPFKRNTSGGEVVTCGICHDQCLPADCFSLHCLHWFCRDCWQSFIETALMDHSIAIHCPHPECKQLVTFDMQQFFAEEACLEEGKSCLIKSFVEERRGKKVIGTYCKNPRGCKGVVFMNEDADVSEALCSLCSTVFCAGCDLPPHAPATCEMLTDWEQKGGYLETGRAEDIEARRLKHLTTKPCPRCGVRIEKNGGCPVSNPFK